MILVAQLGRRRQYAVPNILYHAGLLHRFYTDAYATPFIRKLGCTIPRAYHPRLLRHWLDRVPTIPEPMISSFPLLGIRYRSRLLAAERLGTADGIHLWAGGEFCKCIISRGLGDARMVYGFNSAALELLSFARQRGLQAILEQTGAPIEVEDRYIQQERDLHPDWDETRETASPEHKALSDRQKMEWSVADAIVCGSEFLRQSLTSAGCSPERCYVVPYGVACPAFERSRETVLGRRLRILTVGTVCLQKGSPYILKAAEELRSVAEFRMVGRVNVSAQRRQRLLDSVALFGEVPFSEIHAHYLWADVFLLPSLCEGSAGVCYEALAAGLPVITTHNAGSIVRDGLEGFVVPIRDHYAIAQKILKLDQHRDLLQLLGRNARKRVQEFGSLQQYSERLSTLLGDRIYRTP